MMSAAPEMKIRCQKVTVSTLSGVSSHGEAKGDNDMPIPERRPIDIREYYLRYGPMVFRRCRQLLRDDERAKDALQEVFVRLLTHRGRLADQFPSALLFRIATNVCLNMIRDERRRESSGSEDLLESIAAGDEAENRAVLRDFLDRLFQREPPSTREMAVMRFVDGMTLEEVARETGLSVSGVRKRIRVFSARVRSLRRLVHEE
jgi:RNA polymerase sigma-70 factor (ECF subfamily)